MFLKHQGYSTAIKVLQTIIVFIFLMTTIEARSYHTPTPTPTPAPIPPKPKPKLKNDCQLWYPMPMGNGLAVVMELYDHTLLEHDHDCDGIVDSKDSDVDENGIAVVKDSVWIKKGEAVYIDVLANDVDIDGYIDSDTLAIYTEPLHGRLIIVNARAYYLPNDNYVGEDTFYYVVHDNEGMSSHPVEVRVMITEPNRPPIAYDDSLVTQEDVSLAIVLKGSDVDHNRLTYHLVTKPKNGKLLGTGRNFTYYPHTNFFGKDFLTFRVNDGKVNSSLATIKIEVTAVNDAPKAHDDFIRIEENTLALLTPLDNDTDSDGDNTKLRIVSIGEAKHGKVLLSGKYVHYRANNLSVTHDDFTYSIEDEEGAKGKATIRIEIVHQNHAPIAYNQTIEMYEDETLSLELNGTDIDGDILQYQLMYMQYVPEHGSIIGEAPLLHYTPKPNYVGEDYLVYQVDDGLLHSAAAVIKINVLPRNDPPVAVAGEDVAGIRGDTIVLDGSASYDIDGNITRYLWQEGNQTLSSEKIFSYTFYEEGTHLVTLRVFDEYNATDVDEKRVIITPCCEGCNYPDPTQTIPFQ